MCRDNVDKFDDVFISHFRRYYLLKVKFVILLSVVSYWPLLINVNPSRNR